MNGDRKMMMKLKRAMKGEAAEFKNAAKEGIDEKNKYMKWERANPDLAAARPTAHQEMEERFKGYRENAEKRARGEEVVEEEPAPPHSQQDSYLHLLAMMAKVVEEEEEGLTEKGDGPSSSTAPPPAPQPVSPGSMAGPLAKRAKPQ